jgi:hypothetical protein
MAESLGSVCLIIVHKTTKMIAHYAIALAGQRFQSGAVNQLDLAAGILNEISLLQTKSDKRYASARYADHVCQKVMR